ncbi:hypothetical protein Dimus_036865 [Dionaea muscipula]
MGVCGVEALKSCSSHFMTPYESTVTRGSEDDLERRVNVLKQELKDAEAKLEKARKGKQKV